MNWDSLDWDVLDRLRSTFLSPERPRPEYWHTLTDLELYDATYGARIGWKWDEVLRELRLCGWTAPSGATILDWGCGSGVAGRKVATFFDAANVGRLVLHDRSALAVEFAAHAARAAFPGLAVESSASPVPELAGEPLVLVLSHVVNELDDAARATLSDLFARSACILWVEPGTHADSRTLVEWRERARAEGWHPVAPCPHGRACGLTAADRQRDWCHHFARPPAGIYADSGWVRFGQRAGIDLRSLPYSFLVLDRRPPPTADGVGRILGEPRLYKGYARILGCDAGGVSDLTLQQRTDRELFKSLKHARGPLLYRWTRDRDRIVAARPGIDAPPAPAADEQDASAGAEPA